MLTAKTAVSKNDVLIELVGTETLSGNSASRQTEQTSITDLDSKFSSAYERAKTIVNAMATDFGDSLKDAADVKKIELEFSMGLSSTSGLWVISAKGECALKVKLAWER